eukprot:5288690-Prymnesium_polylepis.2
MGTPQPPGWPNETEQGLLQVAESTSLALDFIGGGSPQKLRAALSDDRLQPQRFLYFRSECMSDMPAKLDRLPNPYHLLFLRRQAGRYKLQDHPHEYYTVSASGVTHFVGGTGSDCIPLNLWNDLYHGFDKRGHRWGVWPRAWGRDCILCVERRRSDIPCLCARSPRPGAVRVHLSSLDDSAHLRQVDGLDVRTPQPAAQGGTIGGSPCAAQPAGGNGVLAPRVCLGPHARARAHTPDPLRPNWPLCAVPNLASGSSCHNCNNT